MTSRYDQIQHACTACRKLIIEQLEAQDALARALARSPDGNEAVVLRDKVGKLKAATEVQFMKAMSALNARGG